MKFKWLGQGIVLLAVGVVLLMGVLGIVNFSVFSLWPLLLLALAYTYERQGWTQPVSHGGMLVPGGILLTYGMMFMACEIFGWRLMAGIWPGFLLGPALGLFQLYLIKRNHGVLISVWILTGLACVFLLGSMLSSAYMLPLLMIGAGVVLLISCVLHNRR